MDVIRERAIKTVVKSFKHAFPIDGLAGAGSEEILGRCGYY